MTDHATHSRSRKAFTGGALVVLYGTVACALFLASFLCAIALAGNFAGPTISDREPAPARPSPLIRTAG